MDPKLIRLEPGSPFDFTNTHARECVVTITTAAGSQIEVRLPPGLSFRIPSAMENLKVSYSAGSPPGIGIAEIKPNEK